MVALGRLVGIPEASVLHRVGRGSGVDDARLVEAHDWQDEVADLVLVWHFVKRVRMV